MILKSVLFLSLSMFSISIWAQDEFSEMERDPSAEQATPRTAEDIYTNSTEAASAPEVNSEASVKKTDEQIAEEESAKVRRDQAETADAKTEEVAPDKAAEKAAQKNTDEKPEVKAKSKSKSRPVAMPKRHVAILAVAAPLTTWVPLKYGGSITGHINNNFGLEVNYLLGKLDGGDLGFDSISDIKENRLDILLRYFTGKSFSIFAGWSLQETEVNLSTKTLDANVLLPYTSTTIKAGGPIIGISNRWQWKSGFTFGMDWISIYLPLSTSVDNDLRKENGSFADQSAYKDIEDAYDKIEDYPRVSILQLGLGWTF